MTKRKPRMDRSRRPDSFGITGELLGWLIASLLLALAYPRPGWGWCVFVALVPAAWLTVTGTRPGRLAWTGFLAAWAWWLVRLNWMPSVTIGGYIALSAAMALYWWAAMVVLRQLRRRYGLPIAIALPMAWVSLEWLRGRWPAGGCPWFTLAHALGPTQDGQPTGYVIQVADLFSEYGVSFLVAMTNGLIVDVLLLIGWRHPHRESRGEATGLPHGERGVPKIMMAGGLWVMLIISAWLYGRHRVGQAPEVWSAGRVVAVVQTSVTLDNKSSSSIQQRLSDWRDMIALTHQAARLKPMPGLIVWPETMVPGGLNAEAINQYLQPTSAWHGYEQFHEQIALLAQRLGVYLLVGGHAYDDWKIVTVPGDQTQYEIPALRYNSTYLYHPDGTQAPVRYDKLHRVPFGEYIPWVEDWPWLKRLFIKYLSPYEVDYTLQPGKNPTVFTWPVTGTTPPEPEEDVVRLVTPICFEDAVGRVCRQLVYDQQGRKRADVLVNVTNDGWYPGTHQGEQHLQIAVWRCIENRVPMIRSVNTGISGFIDSVGRVGPTVHVDGRRQVVAGVVSHSVMKDPRVTLFGRIGHGPAVLLTALTGVLMLGAYIPRGSKPSSRHALPEHQKTRVESRP